MMFKVETGRKRTGGLAIMLRSCSSSSNNSTSATLLKYQNRHHQMRQGSAIRKQLLLNLELAQVFQSGSDPMIPGQRGMAAGSNQIPFS